LNGRKIEPKQKMLSMKIKYLILLFFFTAAVACNNNASVQDRSDSVTDTNNHSTWPEPGDMVGKDSISSPETHSDSSHLKSH
jgi:hypothetical protein